MGEYKKYCLTHQCSFWLHCIECRAEQIEADNRYQIIEAKPNKWDHAKCLRCNKSAWYHFAKHTDEVCEDCKQKEKKSVVILKLGRLIDRAMKNKMSDLRNHLFETLENVKDGDISIEKAKSICEIAQVIINSAKVEIDFIRAVGGKKSDFFLTTAEKPAELTEGV